jgi:diguanylate cyclase (GGDEF)-like protein
MRQESAGRPAARVARMIRRRVARAESLELSARLATLPRMAALVIEIRYCEFLFLQSLATDSPPTFYGRIPIHLTEAGMRDQETFYEMVIDAAERLYIRFGGDEMNFLVERLRGEVNTDLPPHSNIKQGEWPYPRRALKDRLGNGQGKQISITYRGLHRIEDLRDMLRRDRVLEPLGVLLDVRYFRRDLEDALNRSPDTPVSVIRGDMDDFKRINEKHGHLAGDEVMKRYLECLRDGLGNFGVGYRGRGDETVALIIGQTKDVVIDIAEGIRKRVAEMECEYNGAKLPKVSMSLGVATTPPAERTPAVETLADERQIKAKKAGKNRVVFK